MGERDRLRGDEADRGAPIVRGMITSTIHVLILVPAFFPIMKERALRQGILLEPSEATFIQVLTI